MKHAELDPKVLGDEVAFKEDNCGPAPQSPPRQPGMEIFRAPGFNIQVLSERDDLVQCLQSPVLPIRFAKSLQ